MSMQVIYPKTLVLNTIISDPRIMGIIREEGGKMRMSEGHYMEAYNELFEAFRHYQEAGAQVVTCLLVILLRSLHWDCRKCSCKRLPEVCRVGFDAGTQ
jgi:COP9 signalosome complex subunit 2